MSKAKNGKESSDFNRKATRLHALQLQSNQIEDEEQAQRIIDGLPDFQANKVPNLSDEDLFTMYLEHRAESGSVWGPKRAAAYAQTTEVMRVEIMRRMSHAHVDETTDNGYGGQEGTI